MVNVRRGSRCTSQISRKDEDETRTRLIVRWQLTQGFGLWFRGKMFGKTAWKAFSRTSQAGSRAWPTPYGIENEDLATRARRSKAAQSNQACEASDLLFA
jgi:hypothetical protein